MPRVVLPKVAAPHQPGKEDRALQSILQYASKRDVHPKVRARYVDTKIAFTRVPDFAEVIE